MGLKKYKSSNDAIFAMGCTCSKYTKKTCHACNGSGKSDSGNKCTICNGKGKYLLAEHNYGEPYYRSGHWFEKCKNCGHENHLWD